MLNFRDLTILYLMINITKISFIEWSNFWELDIFNYHNMQLGKTFYPCSRQGYTASCEFFALDMYVE